MMEITTYSRKTGSNPSCTSCLKSFVSGDRIFNFTNTQKKVNTTYHTNCANTNCAKNWQGCFDPGPAERAQVKLLIIKESFRILKMTTKICYTAQKLIIGLAAATIGIYKKSVSMSIAAILGCIFWIRSDLQHIGKLYNQTIELTTED